MRQSKAAPSRDFSVLGFLAFLFAAALVTGSSDFKDEQLRERAFCHAVLADEAPNPLHIDCAPYAGDAR